MGSGGVERGGGVEGRGCLGARDEPVGVGGVGHGEHVVTMPLERHVCPGKVGVS